MSMQEHWEHIYATKGPEQTSWYTPHLDASLALVLEAAPDRSATIIDVGGGEATLVDDLLTRGYRELTVLDISGRAIAKSRMRLGTAGEKVRWLVGDVTEIALPPHGYRVWHDRAAFHFLVGLEQRRAYVRQLLSALQPKGHVILATFAPEGPESCSGLAIQRYDAQALLRELGPAFHLLASSVEQHMTPFHTAQLFQYCHFAME